MYVPAYGTLLFAQKDFEVPAASKSAGRHVSKEMLSDLQFVFSKKKHEIKLPVNLKHNKIHGDLADSGIVLQVYQAKKEKVVLIRHVDAIYNKLHCDLEVKFVTKNHEFKQTLSMFAIYSALT